MAAPAAILQVLVKAKGIDTTAAQLGSLDKSARRAGTGLSTAEAHAKRGSKTFSLLGTAAKTAGPLIGAAGLAAGLKTATGEFREAQKVGAQTNAVIKSTGSAANVTKKHIENLAGAISKKAGIDDEAIQSSENMLLTFTKVRNETGKGNKIFDRATQVITDMSVALGQSGKSSAIQLGKALNDPIKGVTALQRVGVTFDAQQKKQIATMVKTGDTLGAQKLILRELTKEFGGSAAAQATNGDKLKVAFGNLAEAAGGVLVPVLDKAGVALTKLINDFVEGKGIAHVIIPVFLSLKDAIAGVIATVSGLVKQYQEGKTGAVLLGMAVAALTAGFVAYKVIATATAVATRTMAAAQLLLNVAMTANPIGLVIVGLVALGAALVVAYKKFGGFRNVVDGVFGWLKAHWPLVLGILTGPIGLAVVTIVKHFGAIKSAVTSTIHGIINFFGGLGHSIANAVRSTLGDLKNFFANVGHAIVNAIVNGIKSAPGAILSAIKSVIPNHVGPVRVPFAAGGRVRGGVAGRDSVPAMLAPGEFVVTGGGEKILERLTGIPGVLDALGAVQPRHFAAGGRVATAANAARAAGFKGNALVTAIAIAGPESGYNPKARLVTPREDSRGLWQINTYAHPWAAKLNLYDPAINARAAYRVYSQAGGFGPWSAYTSGAYRSYLDQAQEAAKTVDKTAAKRAQKTKHKTPQPSLFERKTAAANLAAAQAAVTPASADDIKAMQRQQSVIGARATKIRHALKGKLTKATRVRLQNELADLIGQHAQLGSQIYDLQHPAATASISGGDLTGGGDLSGGSDTGEDPMAAITQAQTDATNAQTQAIKDLKDSIDANTRFAKSVANTEAASLAKSLADAVSGQIAGFGIAGRALTAGAGNLARY